MGTMMEGLDYNPVIYQLISELMWEKELPDPETWKSEYLRSRYGKINEKATAAWKNIFGHYYTQSGLFEPNPIISRPALTDKDFLIARESYTGAKLLIEASEDLKEIDAYRFDLVNLFRQLSGQYAGHLLYEVSKNYREGNLKEFDKLVVEFNDLAVKIEKLMATREEFLFGKWLADSRERATSEQEAKLYEWNARAIITTWGGRVLYGYAIKDWAGLYSEYYLPRWEKFFTAMRNELTGGEKLDYGNFKKDIIQWEDEWVDLRAEKIVSHPTGSSVDQARELWAEYGERIARLIIE
jgi:alpha-N-acetylglucosaminidase